MFECNILLLFKINNSIIKMKVVVKVVIVFAMIHNSHLYKFSSSGQQRFQGQGRRNSNVYLKIIRPPPPPTAAAATTTSSLLMNRAIYEDDVVGNYQVLENSTIIHWNVDRKFGHRPRMSDVREALDMGGHGSENIVDPEMILWGAYIILVIVVAVTALFTIPCMNRMARPDALRNFELAHVF